MATPVQPIRRTDLVLMILFHMILITALIWFDARNLNQLQNAYPLLAGIAIFGVCAIILFPEMSKSFTVTLIMFVGLGLAVFGLFLLSLSMFEWGLVRDLYPTEMNTAHRIKANYWMARGIGTLGLSVACFLLNRRLDSKPVKP